MVVSPRPPRCRMVAVILLAARWEVFGYAPGATMCECRGTMHGVT
jgi:hypothetical protein